MNFNLIYEYSPAIIEGFVLTLVLAAIVLAVCTPIAFAVALIRNLKIPVLSQICAFYVNAFRALPALIVMYFTFYGLPKFGLALQPFAAAILGMSLTSVAYVSEDFRAGLAAIVKGQWDAAASLGLSKAHIVRRIIFPQALPIMIPPFMTNSIITIKATSHASLVGVNELTGASMAAMAITYSATDFLLVAAILYLMISGCMAVAQGIAEIYVSRRYGITAPRPTHAATV